MGAQGVEVLAGVAVQHDAAADALALQAGGHQAVGIDQAVDLERADAGGAEDLAAAQAGVGAADGTLQVRERGADRAGEGAGTAVKGEEACACPVLAPDRDAGVRAQGADGLGELRAEQGVGKGRVGGLQRVPVLDIARCQFRRVQKVKIVTHEAIPLPTVPMGDRAGNTPQSRRQNRLRAEY